MVSSKIGIIRTTQTSIPKTKPSHTVHLGIYLGLQNGTIFLYFKLKVILLQIFCPKKVYKYEIPNNVYISFYAVYS